MADLGFLPGVKRLLDATPVGGQRLLFSATLDNGIDVLVRRYLVNPVVHSVDPAVAPVTTMTHHVFAVAVRPTSPPSSSALAAGARPLAAVHAHQARRQEARQAARAPPASRPSSCTATCRRTRASATSRLHRAAQVRVLVATDIAARGIHVDDIALVVHVDPPAEHKAYLHRSGRTARAGAEGVVVTVMTPEQVGDVRSLAKAAEDRADHHPRHARPPDDQVARGRRGTAGARASSCLARSTRHTAQRSDPAAVAPRRAAAPPQRRQRRRRSPLERADPRRTASEGAAVGRQRWLPAEVGVQHLRPGAISPLRIMPISPAIDLPSYTGSVSMPSSRPAVRIASMVTASGMP